MQTDKSPFTYGEVTFNNATAGVFQEEPYWEIGILIFFLGQLYPPQSFCCAGGYCSLNCGHSMNKPLPTVFQGGML